MRLYSTPRSAVDGEVTKLAIVECVVSVALYVGVEIYLGTFKHLAIAVAAAPLMLLRTDESARWGLQLFVSYSHRLKGRLGVASVDEVARFVAIMITTPFVGTGIRVVTTVTWAVQHPLRAIGSVPQNWFRQSLCTDFMHPPEILPLETLYPAPGIPQFVGVQSALRDLPQEGGGLLFKLFAVAVLAPLLVLGYLPSALYRITFKATALAYAPFVWVAHSTFGNHLSAKDRLERITKGEFEKTRRWLASLVLGMFMAKLLFVYGWVDSTYLLSQVPSERLVKQVLAPSGWPWWQQILVVDALLTFFLLWFADAALPRLNAEHGWREKVVMDTTSTTSFVRATMSLIVVGYVGYLAMADTAMRFLHRFV